MSDNIKYYGISFRLAGVEHKIQLDIHKLDQIVKDNHLKPVIYKIFLYNEAHKAHHYIQNLKNFGKVLLDFTD